MAMKLQVEKRARVELNGLTQADLNDRHGTVIGASADGETWPVLLDPSAADPEYRRVNCKAGNLTVRCVRRSAAEAPVPSAEVKARPHGLNPGPGNLVLQLAFKEPPIPDGATVEQMMALIHERVLLSANFDYYLNEEEPKDPSDPKLDDVECPDQSIGLFIHSFWESDPIGDGGDLFVFNAATDKGFTCRELLQAVAEVERVKRPFNPDEDHSFFEGISYSPTRNGWSAIWGS